VLPAGWRERLIAVCNENTRGATGLCLDPHDLSVAKLVAGREKDMRFIREAALANLVSSQSLYMRLANTHLSAELRSAAESRLATLFGAATLQ
jgi:hypothetical protein